MPFDSDQVDPTVHSGGRYYPPGGGLTDAADRSRGAQAARAVNRLTEGEHERYVDHVRFYLSEGYADDVADAMALDRVYGDDSWRNFRK